MHLTDINTIQIASAAYRAIIGDDGLFALGILTSQ